MVAQNPIRVLIVDDHAMLRKALALTLASYPDLKLVGEAANGEEALMQCAENRPDVVLMDLMMPLMDGITAIRCIRRDYPTIHTIALTSFGEDDLIRSVLRAGATSYLFKKVAADDLARAIRSAHIGLSTVAAEAMAMLVPSNAQPDFII